MARKIRSLARSLESIASLSQKEIFDDRRLARSQCTIVYDYETLSASIDGIRHLLFSPARSSLDKTNTECARGRLGALFPTRETTHCVVSVSSGDAHDTPRWDSG